MTIEELWYRSRSAGACAACRTVGIDRRRELPPFNRRTLAKRLSQKDTSPVFDPIRRVAFFADLYANYNAPELGMAAVGRLEAHGCEVVMPPQKGCGYPYIAYGDLERARGR